jgi:O-antigen ligase
MSDMMSTSALPLGVLSTPGGSDEAVRPSSVLTLSRSQRTVFLLTFAAIGIAVAAPYPATKIALGVTLALYWASLVANFDERFTGMFVLFLPTFVLLPEQILGVPGLNWQTIFLGIFIIAGMSANPPASEVKIGKWLAYFSLVLVMAAIHSWAIRSQPFWPLLLLVKHWLFPFALFYMGRRCFRTEQQLWFLVLAVAVVSLALALHGLRDGVTAGNLLTNRPRGLLTGQANLFAGFLAMHALIFLFVARSRELGRVPRLFLKGTALVMLATLMFTLSRGAWLAFSVTAVTVGLMMNRGLVVLLVLSLLVAYRWAPEEAVTRADNTIGAVETSGDSSLEESLDDSAALRVIQWRTFPSIWLGSPIWGSGLGTYPERLQEEIGISRSPHATLVQIGAEMGALGIIGYAGIFATVAGACIARIRRAPPGAFQRSVGLGLLAATMCLCILDFTGTRFRAYSVTTYFWLIIGAFVGSTVPALEPARSDEAYNPAIGDIRT